jgi:hypothetical protein
VENVICVSASGCTDERCFGLLAMLAVDVHMTSSW